MFELRLLCFLFVHQRLLLTLLLFQLRFLRGNLFARLLELRDGLLPGLVEIAEVGLQTLPALGFCPAENQLNPSMLTLAERGIQLGGQIMLLCRLLFFQFGDRCVHGIDLLIELGEGVLRFAQLTCGCGDGDFLLFELRKQAGTLLLLLAYVAFFCGDIRLNGF